MMNHNSYHDCLYDYFLPIYEQFLHTLYCHNVGGVFLSFYSHVKYFTMFNSQVPSLVVMVQKLMQHI